MKTWIAIADLEVSIPERTLRRWCESGQIRAKKIGKKWFVHIPSMLAENGFEPLAEQILGGHSGQTSGMK